MIPLSAVLSLTALARYIPVVGLVAWLGVALTAFFIGFAHGFRRVSWTALACLLTTAAFVFVNGIIQDLVAQKVPAQAGSHKATVASLLIATGMILLALVLLGLLSWWLRPSVTVKKQPKIERKYGLEIEEDPELDGLPPRRLHYRNQKDPTIFGRIFGGLFCALTVTAVMLLAASFVLLFIKGTGLANSFMNVVFQSSIVELVYQYGSKYAFDFAMISLVIIISMIGYKKGFIGSLYTLLVTVGGVMMGLVAFCLPFLPASESRAMYFINKLVGRCTRLLGGVPEIVRPIAGKLLAAAGLFVIAMLLVFVMKLILNKCSKAIAGVRPIRAVDGVFASFVYCGVGIGICVAIWVVLYVLEYCGLFYISDVLSEETTLAQGLYNFSRSLVGRLIAR